MPVHDHSQKSCRPLLSRRNDTPLLPTLFHFSIDHTLNKERDEVTAYQDFLNPFRSMGEEVEKTNSSHTQPEIEKWNRLLKSCDHRDYRSEHRYGWDMNIPGDGVEA